MTVRLCLLKFIPSGVSPLKYRKYILQSINLETNRDFH
jgi:hypothetical protein